MAHRGWRKVFLQHLATCGNVTESARVAGVTREAAYRARDRTPSFREKWDIALEESVELLEAEARRRASEGYDEPVFYQGKQVGSIRRYSDTLMSLLLKAHKPDVYRERHDVRHENLEAETVTIEVVQSNGGEDSGS